MERALHWLGAAYGLRWMALRYCNAAGADPDGELGEEHDPKTHLVPRLIQAALGKIPALDIYGTDYPTPDGTAIRDYIHVGDLAAAHANALDYLVGGGDSQAVNLGTGAGISVRQVVRAVESIAGKPVPVREAPRRPGDPPILVADASRAHRLLQWSPRRSDLESILDTAWRWHAARAGAGNKTRAAPAPKREGRP